MKMRKNWGNVLILPNWEWEAGSGPGTKLVLVPVLVSSVLAVFTKYWDQDKLSSAMFSFQSILFDVKVPTVGMAVDM